MKHSLIVGLVSICMMLVHPAFAQTQSFEQWLAEFRIDAKARGISDKIFDEALGNAKPIPRVIELDRNQPEFKMTFDEYLGKVVSKARQRIAAKKMIEHDEILTKVSKKYGVQKRFIITFWGVETSFGRYLGSFNVPHSLATLAYDGRRSAYFRKELLNALQILEEGHITAANMKGSWAGAMGQSQFMPSSFLSYAVDWHGDGQRDIWATTEDVFASTAYYLSKAGWRDDRTWGRKVSIPKGFKMNGKTPIQLAMAKTYVKLSKWSAAGALAIDGSALPTADLKARLIMPSGASGPTFLAYSNFDSILAWNRSNYYALAIGHLSDTLR